MKRKSYEFLKTVDGLENCIECVQDDVENLLNSLPDNSDIDRNAIEQRAFRLMFWLNKIIDQYDA